jgi:hypothetical protein
MGFRRIRITQPTWLGFTGHMASVEFVDGVSTTFVPQNIYDRIAAELSIVDDRSEEILGVQTRMISARLKTLNVLPDTARAPVVTPEVVVEFVPPPPVLTPKWTKETLEALADKTGIKGLREIGDPLSAKGRAIPELIEAILRAQNEVVARREGQLARLSEG